MNHRQFLAVLRERRDELLARDIRTGAAYIADSRVTVDADDPTMVSVEIIAFYPPEPFRIHVTVGPGPEDGNDP
jgi:hypothetical protein